MHMGRVTSEGGGIPWSSGSGWVPPLPVNWPTARQPHRSMQGWMAGKGMPALWEAVLGEDQQHDVGAHGRVSVEGGGVSWGSDSGWVPRSLVSWPAAGRTHTDHISR